MRTELRLKRVNHTVSHRQQGAAVVLEDVYDPHNAEAVFRSCDAMGIQHVHLVFDRQMPYDPLEIGHRSSSSAHKWLTFHVHHSSDACIAALQSEGYSCLGTALTDDAESLYGTDFTRHDKVALFFGNERTGLQSTTMEKMDAIITIPMAGMVQSLNISVSAGILLFELVRQRRASATKERWELVGEAQDALRDHFVQL